jgi:hypothetical protein
MRTFDQLKDHAAAMCTVVGTAGESFSESFQQSACISNEAPSEASHVLLELEMKQIC